MNEISKEQLLYMKRTRQHKQFVLFFQLFLFIFFIILWEITSRAGIINAFIFSSPSRMLASGKELLLNSQLLKHLGITLAETFASFFLVTAVSLFTAILLWWNNTLSEILEPYFVILNSLPKSAMAPIFIVWLGNNMKTIIVHLALIHRESVSMDVMILLDLMHSLFMKNGWMMEKINISTLN